MKDLREAMKNAYTLVALAALIYGAVCLGNHLGAEHLKDVERQTIERNTNR